MYIHKSYIDIIYTKSCTDLLLQELQFAVCSGKLSLHRSHPLPPLITLPLQATPPLLQFPDLTPQPLQLTVPVLQLKPKSSENLVIFASFCNPYVPPSGLLVYLHGLSGGRQGLVQFLEPGIGIRQLRLQRFDLRPQLISIVSRQL